MINDGEGIRYFDDPWSGKKIKSTPETRLKARRIHARCWCERVFHRGFMRTDLEYAAKYCREASLNLSKELKPYIKRYKEQEA